MKNGRMQAKDVPDLPVLEFIHRVRTEGVPPPADAMEWNSAERWYHVTWFNYGDEIPTNSVMRAMPDGTPEKVALAKMRRLIARGLVDGCPCGCRGDFELTDKGREMIGQPAPGAVPITSPRYFADIMALSYGEFVKRTPYASIGRETVDTDRIGRLLRASGFEEVVTVHGPARVGKTAALVHQLQMASVYDHAYWEARLHSIVLSAMMNAYIDTGSATFTPPEPAYGVPPIDRERMMLHTLAEQGFLVSGMDVAADQIEINLPPSGEMGPAFDADRFFPIAAPPLPSQPDYLRHDPTKKVGKRRQRKAYGRKGDRR